MKGLKVNVRVKGIDKSFLKRANCFISIDMEGIQEIITVSTQEPCFHEFEYLRKVSSPRDLDQNKV
jgi:hypothetical protein